MAAENLIGPVRPLSAIDRDTIAQALTEARGYIGRAAKKLGVPTAELRRLCLAEPRLVDAALEAAERKVDKAEAAILRAMRKGQLSNRLQAAAWIARRGRRY